MSTPDVTSVPRIWKMRTAEFVGGFCPLPPRPENIYEVTRIIALHRHLLPVNVRQIAVRLIAEAQARHRRPCPLTEIIEAIVEVEIGPTPPGQVARFAGMSPTETYFVNYLIKTRILPPHPTDREVANARCLANAITVAHDHLGLTDWAALLLNREETL